MARFVHAADLHLDSPLRGLDAYQGAPVAEIRGATRRAFENLMDLCRSTRAEFLLLAGDLFDGDWPDWSTGLFCVQQLTELVEAGTRVFLIRGNHDAQSVVHKHLPWPVGVHEFDSSESSTVELDEVGVAIHGQSFANAKVTADLARGYPDPVPGRINIGILHTALDGRVGHASYAPTTVGTLRGRGYDYWALGHVHQREVVARDPWIVFPGNLQGRHIRETGAKGATVVTFDESGIQGEEHVELDVVRWAEVPVDISSCVDLDDVVEATRSAVHLAAGETGGRLLAARVQLCGRIAAGAEELSDVLHGEPERCREAVRSAGFGGGGASVWIERIKIRARREDPLRTSDSGLDPMDLLRQACRELREDPEARRALVKEHLQALDRLRVELRGNLDEHATPELIDDVEQLLWARLSEGGG